MTMAPSQLGAFTRSDPTQDRANIQYHVQPLSLDKFGEPLHPFPAFTASVDQCAARPAAARSRSNPPIRPQPPAISAELSVDAGGPPRRRRFDPRHAQRSCAQPALQKYSPVEYLPGDASAR